MAPVGTGCLTASSRTQRARLTRVITARNERGECDGERIEKQKTKRGGGDKRGGRHKVLPIIRKDTNTARCRNVYSEIEVLN